MINTEPLIDEGFYGTCEMHEDEHLEDPSYKVWRTSSNFNACRDCIRIHELQPLCPWSGAIVKLPE